MRTNVAKSHPKPDEAVIFWLYAAGMTVVEISKALKLATQTVSRKLKAARDLARSHRIWYVSTETKENVPEKSGAGMEYLKQLAQEAGLK